MSTKLEEALVKAKSLTASRQDQIAEMIFDVVEQDQSDLQLDANQIEEVTRRVRDPNPVYATDEQIEAFFAKFAT